MTVEERHNSKTGALKEVEGAIKGKTDFTSEDRKKLEQMRDVMKETNKIAKRVSEPSKFMGFIHKIIEPLFWIGLVASFVFGFTGYYESAWTLMFITLINRQVMFEKYKTNQLNK